MDNNKEMEFNVLKNRYGFLYRKIHLSSYTIEKLLTIKEFEADMQDSLSKNHAINDWTFYLWIKNKVFPMMKAHSNNMSFKDDFIEQHGKENYKTWYGNLKMYQSALNKLAEHLYGSASRWLEEYKEQTGSEYINPEKKKRETIAIPEGCEDISYIIEICDCLKHGTLRRILNSEPLVRALRSAGKVASVNDFFEVFRDVFYPMARHGYKNHEDINKRRAYIQMRNIAFDLSEKIFGDPYAWHEDYNEYYNS